MISNDFKGGNALNNKGYLVLLIFQELINLSLRCCFVKKKKRIARNENGSFIFIFVGVGLKRMELEKKSGNKNENSTYIGLL